MKQLFGEVTANIALGPDTHILCVRAPEIAAHAVPGQSVHVRCASGPDPLLRRPLSIARVHNRDPVAAGVETLHATSLRLRGEGQGAATDATGRAGVDPWREEFALLVEIVGRGSALLAASRVGDRLDLLGPLGRGFALHPKARQILLVAGGVGIAPLLALADAALRREVGVTLLCGARSAAKVFPAALVPPQVEYIVLTDDGSRGRHGLVTAAVPDYLPWADQLFACGPEPMLRALARIVLRRDWGVPDSAPPFAQVSVERRMGCAVGACFGCVVDTNAGRQRVCRDGPVFDLREVTW